MSPNITPEGHSRLDKIVTVGYSRLYKFITRFSKGHVEIIPMRYTRSSNIIVKCQSRLNE
ncbi:hypothetical protein SK128_014591, partial [Halocaridina rubra]